MYERLGFRWSWLLDHLHISIIHVCRHGNVNTSLQLTFGWYLDSKGGITFAYKICKIWIDNCPWPSCPNWQLAFSVWFSIRTEHLYRVLTWKFAGSNRNIAALDLLETDHHRFDCHFDLNRSGYNKHLKRTMPLLKNLRNFLAEVPIFWEGHKNLRNLHRYYIGQIYSGYFAKICGLLRI